MTTSSNLELLEKKNLHSKFSIFETPQIDGFWLLSEIIFKVSKHFPIIILSFASLKLLMVVHDVYTHNLGFAILNSAFAIGDFIFLFQIHHNRKIYQKTSSQSQEKMKSGFMENLKE